MHMSVDVRCEGVHTPTRSLKSDATKLLRHLNVDGELSVVLCDDPFIHALNKKWRGKDTATDVLSFPMEEPGLLGDIVISIYTARRDRTPLRVLLVHGLCHLLGFDHEEENAAIEMRTKETELLTILGEPPVGLVERADRD